MGASGKFKGTNMRRILISTSALLLLILIALSLSFCGGGGGSSSSSGLATSQADPPPIPLSTADVQNLVTNAVQSVDSPMIVAVSDRVGNVLAVFRTAGVAKDAIAIGNYGQVV